MKPFEYLNTSVKSYQMPSKVHGVGVFALVDIGKGEYVFPNWEGRTKWYRLRFREAKELPKEVLAYLLRSYGSKINDDYSYISFRLIKDTNFLFSEPLAMLNTMYENGNIDSTTGIALRDISKDEEIFGNYGNSSQIKLL